MNVPDRFHFTHRRLVEIADTDLAGLMHFTNFLRFAESAEHAFFRSLGFPVHRTDGPEHRGWPKLGASCKYLKPARFEQTLEICLRIQELSTSSLTYGFWIFGPGEPPHPLLAAGACTIIHVTLDPRTHEIRKAPIPADLRHALDRAAARS
jgi:acyl-CoA thioester hydrolase